MELVREYLYYWKNILDYSRYQMDHIENRRYFVAGYLAQGSCLRQIHQGHLYIDSETAIRR
jgi:hypothetical protein